MEVKKPAELIEPTELSEATELKKQQSESSKPT